MQIKCATEENADGSLNVEIDDISNQEWAMFTIKGKEVDPNETDQHKLFELAFIKCLEDYIQFSEKEGTARKYLEAKELLSEASALLDEVYAAYLGSSSE